MPLGASLDEVLELVPELAGPRTVSELPGGLTNANHKVVTDGGRVRGAALERRHRPAGHRPRQRALELRAGRGDRRRRAGRRLPARAQHDGLRVHRGRDDERRGAARRRPHGARRRRVPPPARRPALPRRLRHVRDAAALPRDRPGARLQAAGPLPRVRAPRGRHPRRVRRARRGHRPVQQRPAGRELPARAGRLPPHRLRVLGQQRRVLRARQRLERVQPLARAARTSSSPPTTVASCATRSPALGCGA